ncbi:LysM peptidoglycan-binding domain-containing protein [Fredinandcohnia humi]
MKQFDEKPDVLNTEDKDTSSTLPPRSEVHKEKKKKTKVKIKYPIIRLLALLFVLLPVAILSYQYNPDNKTKESTHSNKSSTFESIPYEKEEVEQPEELPVKEDKPDDDTASASHTTDQQQEPEDKQTTTTPTGPNYDKNKISPPEESTVRTEPVNKEESIEKYDIKYHKVQADETLYSVSIKYYKSRSGEELIKRWNNLNGETIMEGQVLRIPIKISN